MQISFPDLMQGTSVFFIGSNWDYLIHRKRNINHLKEEMDRLAMRKADVELLVNTARHKGEKILNEVESWLERAGKLQTEVDALTALFEEANTLGVSKGAAAVICRVSKEAKEKTQIIGDLRREGQFNAISCPLPPPSFQDISGNDIGIPTLSQDLSVANETVERFLLEMAKEKPHRFTSQELQIFTNNYSNKLGSGGFGDVYKGKFPNGVDLAVKLLKNSADKRVEEQFMAEVGSIERTNHKNLVRLYGFCCDTNTKALIYEYMENGSLDSILFDRKNHNIEWSKLYEIAIGVARALAYLHHDCRQMIIHYDIKPGNVLLDSIFCAKVADFGLAKLCNQDKSHVTLTGGGRGTPGYAAPEMWMPLPVTYKCDVYSFGVMLFEILGRRKNLDSNVSESIAWFPKQVWEKFEMGELGELLLVECGIEEKDREKAKVMAMVALWCVQYLPAARPSMNAVVQILEGGIEVTAPPNPFQHLASSGSVGLILSMETSTETTTGGSIKPSPMKMYEIEVATSK